MENFTEYLEINGYAGNTIRAYTATVAVFLAAHDPDTAGPADILDFLMSYPPASRRRHWAALRAYYRRSERNPVADIPIPPAPVPRVPVPSFAEAVAIMEATNDPRNRLILELLYGSGIRVGALLSIEIRNIDFTNQWILCREKGGAERVLPFGANSEKWLRIYLEGRQQSGLLFPGLTARSVRRIIANACAKVGIPPIGPHGFRHAFAAAIRKAGGDIVELKNLLGHQDIRSTERYLAVTPVTLSDSRKKHPRK